MLLKRFPPAETVDLDFPVDRSEIKYLIGVLASRLRIQSII